MAAVKINFDKKAKPGRMEVHGLQLEHLECGCMKGGICHPIIPSRGKIVEIIFGGENKRAVMNLD